MEDSAELAHAYGEIKEEENRNFFGSLSFYLRQIQQIAGQDEPQPVDVHVMYHLIIENSDEFTSRSQDCSFISAVQCGMLTLNSYYFH